MKNCRSTLLILVALFIASSLTSIAQHSAIEIRTDAMARKVVQYFNAGAPDSAYALGGVELKKQISPVLWKNVFETQLIPLLPFTSVEFIGSTDFINKYKLSGKQTVTFLLSLDESSKIKVLLFQPFEEELKAAPMDAQEMRTDGVAQQVLSLINQKQADSAYFYAGDSFRAGVDKASWKSICERNLFPLTPLSPAIFLGSKNGVNQYKIKQFLFSVGLDQNSKFSTLLIQPYQKKNPETIKILSDNPMKTHLDSLVNAVAMEHMQTKGSVGLSAGISLDGNDYFYNYGEVKLGNGQLPARTSLYDIGSITKTFTSTLLAIAVGQKKVNLDTPITKYLPDSVASNSSLKNITLKMLANHTSGLPRMPEDIGRSMIDINQPYEEYDAGDLYSFLKQFKEVRAPGVKYEYSNLGAGLLGVILENILQKPYHQLLEDFILSPANLRQTSLVVSAADRNLIAQGYDETGKPIDMWLFKAMEGAGALKSSSTDLLHYGKLQWSTGNTELTKAVQLTHQITFDDNHTVMGLGWHILPENKAIVQHSGGTGGYKSFVGAHLQKKFAIAVLTNSAGGGGAFGIRLLQAVEESGSSR